MQAPSVCVLEVTELRSVVALMSAWALHIFAVDPFPLTSLSSHIVST